MSDKRSPKKAKRTAPAAPAAADGTPVVSDLTAHPAMKKKKR